jgi:hypothetical protein
MHGAFAGADAVEACLDDPRRGPRALKAYDASVRRGIGAFSWFIYRVTAPGLREILMNPNNRFRLRDALLSVLAGNVFGATRTSGRILALKALYYLFSLRDLGTSWTAWRSRRRAIRERGVDTAAT